MATYLEGPRISHEKIKVLFVNSAFFSSFLQPLPKIFIDFLYVHILVLSVIYKKIQKHSYVNSENVNLS